MKRNPFQSWELSNNNAEIRRIRQRIDSLTRARETVYGAGSLRAAMWEANREQSRLQVFFDGNPTPTPAKAASDGHKRRGMAAAFEWERLLRRRPHFKYSAPYRREAHGTATQQHPAAAGADGTGLPSRRNVSIGYTPPPAATARKTCTCCKPYVPQTDGTALKIGAVLYAGTEEKCRELLDQLNTGS